MRLCGFIAFLVLALVVTTTPAQADLIKGEIRMTGDAKAAGGAGPDDLAGATGIDFDPNTFMAIGATKDFGDHVGFGDIGTIKDFTFKPVLDVIPNNPLWTIGGFSFDLNAIEGVTQNVNVLAVHGTGVVSGNGFDPTGGTFTITLIKGNHELFWIANTVPEPTSLVLLGLGAVALIRRHRRKTT